MAGLTFVCFYLQTNHEFTRVEPSGKIFYFFEEAAERPKPDAQSFTQGFAGILISLRELLCLMVKSAPRKAISKVENFLDYVLQTAIPFPDLHA